MRVASKKEQSLCSEICRRYHTIVPISTVCVFDRYKVTSSKYFYKTKFILKEICYVHWINLFIEMNHKNIYGLRYTL